MLWPLTLPHDTTAWKPHECRGPGLCRHPRGDQTGLHTWLHRRLVYIGFLALRSLYRGTSVQRNSTHLRPSSRNKPRALFCLGGGAVSYERGTPVHVLYARWRQERWTGGWTRRETRAADRGRVDFLHSTAHQPWCVLWTELRLVEAGASCISKRQSLTGQRRACHRGRPGRSSWRPG